MDTRNGDIYASRDAARLAGVPDDDLVTGSPAALEKLRKRITFSGGSFKQAEDDPEAKARFEAERDAVRRELGKG